MLSKSLPADGRLAVIAGGATRNDTLANAIAYVEKQFGLAPDTVLLTHDAVRPFVTHRIISENIEAARKYGACDTVVAASDTIVESADNRFISAIPERRMMYQGQTPQTFLALKLKTVFESLTTAEKATLTDACKVFSLKGEPVRLVEGEVFNIKITYPFDLKVAAALLAEASLSFLGLGIQPPNPSWGAMLARAYQAMDVAPEQMYPPGLAILFTALAFNALGESMRVALDPTLKK